MDSSNGIEIPQVQKQSSGKKVGFFFLALTPAAASLLLQVILGGVYIIIATLIQMTSYQVNNPAATVEEIMDFYMKTAMNEASGGILCYHFLSIPIFGLWYYFGCKKPSMKQSVKNLSIKAIIISVVGGVILCLMTNGIVGIEQYVMPHLVQEFADLMESVGMGEDALANISAILLAPIGEELVCRGITLHYAKKALPRFWMANVFQALMFGVMHMNLIQGIYAFAIGLFLGFLAERYKSILPCVLVHFVVNFSTTVWIDKAFSWIPDSLPAQVILFVLSLGIILMLVWWSKKPDESKL